MSIDTIINRRISPTRADGLRALGRQLAHLAGYFLACLEVARQRRRLLALDASTLQDIGISRADAQREAGRSFWDIPDDLKPGD